MKNQKLQTACYQEDLAFVHDQGYGQYAQGAANTLADLLKHKSPPETLIVDLGCGSGILASALTQKHFKVVGVDYSSAMIKIAREKVPAATFYTGSLFDFEIPNCEAVCSIGECFNYLFDNKDVPGRLDTLFARIYYALHVGGYLIFDILTTEILKTDLPSYRMVEHPAWTMFIELSGDEQTSVLTRTITLFLKQGEVYRKSQEIHRQQLFVRQEIIRILKNTGFEVTEISQYDGITFRQGHIGFICKK